MKHTYRKCTHLLAGVSALIVVSLVGCGVGESNVVIGNREGILHLGNASEPTGLDPHVVTTTDASRILGALFEGLVTRNPWTLEPEPGVAERWEISTDGLIYTFHINPKAVWSNGEPITASDYVWTWKRALHPKTGNRNAYLLYVIDNAEAFATGAIDDFGEVGVKALEEAILQVTLRGPTPHFLVQLMHHSSYALHPETILKHGEMTDRFTQWTRPENFVGNGPFILEEWAMNRYIKVGKSPTYWDRDKVSLNGVVFYPIEDDNIEERMFRVDQLHRTFTLPLDKIPAYSTMPDTPFRTAPYLGSYFYVVNNLRAPTDDVRVRKALALAVDREKIARTIMYDSVIPAYGVVPPFIPHYTPPAPFAFNPERARELLAEAGYPDGEGWPGLEITYNTSEAHRKIAIAIQQMWKKNLGVEITLANQEWKVYVETVNQKDYQVARMGWIGDVYPSSFLELFLTDGGNNDSGYSDPRFDDLLISKGGQSVTREERYRYMQQAEALLMDAMPIIPIYSYTTRLLQHPSVEGMPLNVTQSINLKYAELVPGRTLPDSIR
ncbi:oligopeptide ABC transporter periplasmic oligopeptide-binding protein [Luminiphilus syltensis NOR5-1B]|uniref:Oligopeptide ABC transporter periplasmic oligopeptide-binding protein n=1 Tax=Luminiphilus syltensis NOR5-1B TaxID=565045 RepID=B8KXN0_9GAMM|nr:peptide ABC transporter substrate-binding protein [Luminiphilus syltensis]EED34251.1 oligopeptide ABC transporter periplasmic oligopeptide-binding protein [Luminiphilus syltensis NOR5-1B]